MEEGLHQEIKVLHDGKNEARRDLAAKQKDIKGKSTFIDLKWFSSVDGYRY